MKIKNIKTLFLLIGCIFWTELTWAQDYVTIPKSENRVTDLTGTLSATEINSLESKLKSFEDQKGSQIVVLIVPTTQPEEIEQYGIRVAEAWKIGREGVDDGVILLVAKSDRKVRIEVGYGLEGAIPDIYAKRIVENIILPAFRNGNFDGGIEAGVNALIDLVNGEELPAVTHTATKNHGNSGSSRFGLFGLIILFIILSVIGKLIKASWFKIIIAFFLAILIGWLVASIATGFVSLVVSLIALFSKSGGGGSGRSGGGYYGGGFYGGGSSFGGGGGGFSGGGFSGGGGGFGGGGASGGW